MRSGAKNLRMAFTSNSLTHFGGINVLHAFLQRIKFRTFISEHIRFSQRNNHYTLSETLLALLYPMILGLEKIEVSALLKTNGVFQTITGLPSFPNPTTLRRFLLRTSPHLLPQLRVVHDRLRRHFLQRPMTLSSFWLDCDSTACTLYGHQEGVVRGYNPNHPGKKSYHPLIITEAHLGDCLAGVLRHGNAHTAEGVLDLLRKAQTVLPHGNRWRLRADCGFYEGNFVDAVREDMEFAIVAKMTNPIKEIVAAKRYERVGKESPFAVGQFRYKPHGWKREERFVVLRRDLPPDDEDQMTLFTVDNFAYHVIVTNMTPAPYQIFRFYQDRSAMERIIRILKEDYPFGSAPTKSFAANELYAELSMLAYNLMTWFKRLCLPEEWQSCTLPTVRHRLLMIPGEFVNAHNVPLLRLPRNAMYRDVMQDALEKIRKLDPLI